MDRPADLADVQRMRERYPEWSFVMIADSLRASTLSVYYALSLRPATRPPRPGRQTVEICDELWTALLERAGDEETTPTAIIVEAVVREMEDILERRLRERELA